MTQPNLANDSNRVSNSENSNQEQTPIDLATRFRKAFLMAAVMLAIGWAMGVV